MGTTATTKAEIPMDLSKATEVFEQHALSQQVSDEMIEALRVSIITGANGETVADRAFTTLIEVAEIITEPQKARLLTGLAKSGETTARYGVIAEIITCGKVKPRRTESWKSLRTAVNTVPKEMLGQVVTEITGKTDKVVSFAKAGSIIKEMVDATKVAKVIKPETAALGFLKSQLNYLVKVNTLVSEGMTVTDEMREIANRSIALGKAILGE